MLFRRILWKFAYGLINEGLYYGMVTEGTLCVMPLKPVLQLWVIVSHWFMLNPLEIMKDIFCLKGVNIAFAVSSTSEFTLTS